MLETLGAKIRPNAFLGTNPMPMLWTYVTRSISDSPFAQRMHMWEQQVGVIVDDLEDATTAQETIDEPLSVLGAVYSEAVDEAAEDTVKSTAEGEEIKSGRLTTPSTDRLLVTFLGGKDRLRKHAAALLLRAQCLGELKLTPTQTGRLAGHADFGSDRLMWETYIDLVAVAREHAAALLPDFEQVLPHLDDPQTEQLIERLGQLGPDAVPLLCRIVPANDSQRQCRIRSLESAAVGDQDAVATIVYEYANRDESEFAELMRILSKIDTEYRTTRRVIDGNGPPTEQTPPRSWRKFRESVLRQIGDVY